MRKGIWNPKRKSSLWPSTNDFASYGGSPMLIRFKIFHVIEGGKKSPLYICICIFFTWVLWHIWEIFVYKCKVIIVKHLSIWWFGNKSTVEFKTTSTSAPGSKLKIKAIFNESSMLELPDYLEAQVQHNWFY